MATSLKIQNLQFLSMGMWGIKKITIIVDQKWENLKFSEWNIKKSEFHQLNIGKKEILSIGHTKIMNLVY